MVSRVTEGGVLPAWSRRQMGTAVVLVSMWLFALHSLLWLRRVAGDALWWDFGVYVRAYGEAVAGGNPYVPFHIGQGFLNHPFVLTLVGFVTWLPSPSAGVIWMAASAVAWVGAIWVANRIVMCANGVTMQPAVALLLLGFAPAIETFYVGQIDAFAVLAITLCIWWAERRRPVAAGIALALAIVLKTSPVVLLGYFVGLRAVPVLATALGVLVACSIVPALQFSPSILLDFGTTVARLSSDIYISVYNQSVISVVARLPAVGDAAALSGALAVGGVTVALVVAGLRTDPQRIDARWRLWYISLFVGVMVIGSPLVWYHHVTLLLVPLTALLYAPNPVAVAAGVGALLLFQGERLFEAMSGLSAVPALLAQLGIVLAMLWLWYRATQRIPSTSPERSR